jgi:hypothetical protein
MKKRITGFIIFAAICGIVYFLLSQHIVFYTGGEEKKITLLPKSTLTLDETFVSLETGEYAGLEDVLKRSTLRDDGLGDIMVEWGLVTDDELAKMLNKIDSEY